MAEIERYIEMGITDMRRWSGGSWVKFSDHKVRIRELQAENERLRTALSKIGERLVTRVAEMTVPPGFEITSGYERGRCDERRHWLDALDALGEEER